MEPTKRQLLNVLVIRTSFRAAAESHPGQLAAAVRSALHLLAEALTATTSPEVVDEIAAVKAEVESAGGTENRREG